MRLVKNILRWILNVAKVWRRECYLTFRDEAVVIFFIVVCAIYPVLYTLIYNTEVANDMKVVVVDHDRSHLTREFVRQLDATAEVCVIDYVSNLQDARRLMNEHECYGIVYFPAHFTRNALGGAQGHVSLYADMGVLMRYKQMLTAMTNVQQHVCSQIQGAKISVISGEGGSIIENEHVPLGNVAMGVASAVLPCILLLVLQQSMVLGICTLHGGSCDRRLRNREVGDSDVFTPVWAHPLSEKHLPTCLSTFFRPSMCCTSCPFFSIFRKMAIRSTLWHSSCLS